MSKLAMIFAIMMVVLVSVILLVFVAGIIRERRLPVGERLERVARKLATAESATGATSILSSSVSGIDDEMVRQVANREGYDWVGYSGQQDRRLNFQRRLAASPDDD